MPREKKEPVSANGVFVGTVTDGAGSEEATTRIRLTVGEEIVFETRPEYPALVSRSPQVSRFARGIIERLKPPPPPRPILPVPKPSRASQADPVTLPSGFVRCPQCAGTGQFGHRAADAGIICDMCDGAGAVREARLEELGGHDPSSFA